MLGKHWLVNGVENKTEKPNAFKCASLGVFIGMRRPVIAATKKRRDLAGPPLDLIDSLSEPQGSVAAAAKETESTQRTKKGSGGLGDDLEGRGLHR